ncbi:MAG: tetratricopeptide repeat protein, partial [Myxococcales bacterium]|nr:tetratricopeptide repeat protein [Myxococcales bacterium]
EDREELRDTAPLPLHPLSEGLVEAYDRYVELGLNPEDDPNTQGRFAFLAARTLFDHRHYDEARERFLAIVENPVYRAQREGVIAASFYIETFQVNGDFTGMQGALAMVSGLDWGEDIDQDFLEGFREDAVRMQVGAMFLSAEELYQAEQYEEAALEYVRLVNENPDSEFAAAALNNAAVAYEEIRRFEPAMRLYQRLVEDYPDAEFVDRALYRVAANSERFFDFERAVNTYLIIADRENEDNPDRPRLSLFAAANLLKNSGRSEESAQTYEEYVRRYSSEPDAPVALYNAGLMYQRAGDTREMERVWNQMRREYGNDAPTDEVPIDAMVIDSLRQTADYYDELGDSREAQDYYGQVLDEFARRQPGDVDSMYSAGKAQFWMAERAYEEWDSTDLQGSVAQQRRNVTTLIEGIPDVREQFLIVTDIGSAEWTVAALFMQGRIYQSFADKLYAAPIPEEIANDDDLAMGYQIELEDVALRFEDEAIASWEVSIGLVRDMGIVNDWTIRLVRELNRYRGSEYPLYKEEPELVQELVISPTMFAVPEGLQAPEMDGSSGGSDDGWDDVPDDGGSNGGGWDDLPADDGAGDSGDDWGDDGSDDWGDAI